MTRWVLRPVGPQGAADGLGYIQVPQVLAPGLMLNRSVSPGDPTHHHQSRYPKSRLFEYLPDLPSDVEILLSRHTLSPRTPRRPNCKGGFQSDVSSCTSPVTRWVLRPVGPQGAADGLGYIQVPQVLAPGLVLNRSVSPGDPTHHHQSRYPKSRLLGYLPDLPSV